ncbi:44973_t:CDS:2, partial [Gigaspora margarita]
MTKLSLLNEKALAELWDVEDSDLLHYLGIENNLVAVDTALREVLRGFSSSFGGTYLDVRNNTVYCNTVDETKVPIVKSSSLLTQRGYVDFITFKPAPAGNSVSTLKSRFKRLSQLIRLYEPLDIHIYIDHKLNNVVLLHDPEDDKENKDFLERANKFNPSLIAPNNIPTQHSRDLSHLSEQQQDLDQRTIKKKNHKNDELYVEQSFKTWEEVEEHLNNYGKKGFILDPINHQNSQSKVTSCKWKYQHNHPMTFSYSHNLRYHKLNDMIQSIEFCVNSGISMRTYWSAIEKQVFRNKNPLKNLYNAIQAAKNHLNKRIKFDASDLMHYLYSKYTEDSQ